MTNKNELIAKGIRGNLDAGALYESIKHEIYSLLHLYNNYPDMIILDQNTYNLLRYSFDTNGTPLLDSIRNWCDEFGKVIFKKIYVNRTIKKKFVVQYITPTRASSYATQVSHNNLGVEV